MSKQDDYLANATLCQRQAEQSTDEDDRRQWVSMAQSWIGLIQMRDSVDAFSAERRAMSIGQKESAESIV